MEEDRIRRLNDRDVDSGGRYVLYWMQQSQRAEYNHALEYAVQQANRMGQGAEGGTRAEFSELRLAQMRGLARFILDSADEIDLLLRRRRDAMQLEATAALREFAHAAE